MSKMTLTLVPSPVRFESSVLALIGCLIRSSARQWEVQPKTTLITHAPVSSLSCIPPGSDMRRSPTSFGSPNPATTGRDSIVERFAERFAPEKDTMYDILVMLALMEPRSDSQLRLLNRHAWPWHGFVKMPSRFLSTAPCRSSACWTPGFMWNAWFCLSSVSGLVYRSC